MKVNAQMLTLSDKGVKAAISKKTKTKNSMSLKQAIINTQRKK
jgi:hypothetical protein